MDPGVDVSPSASKPVLILVIILQKTSERIFVVKLTSTPVSSFRPFIYQCCHHLKRKSQLGQQLLLRRDIATQKEKEERPILKLGTQEGTIQGIFLERWVASAFAEPPTNFFVFFGRCSILFVKVFSWPAATYEFSWPRRTDYARPSGDDVEKRTFPYLKLLYLSLEYPSLIHIQLEYLLYDFWVSIFCSTSTRVKIVCWVGRGR